MPPKLRPVAEGKGRTAALNAAPQTVAPGALSGFTLTLTKPVTQVLKKLSPRKWLLRMPLTASATNVVGAPSTTTSTVWLKGQAKAIHRKSDSVHHRKEKG